MTIAARLLAILLAVGTGSPAWPCSVFPHPDVFDSRVTYLEATATPEVVATPIASAPFEAPAEPEVVFGQVVGVGRLIGHVPPQLLVALQAEGRRAVLVPWDHLGDCKSVGRARRDAWAPIGATGVYHGYLRPLDRWADGLPTIDVTFFGSQPYLPTMSRDPDAGGPPPLAVSEYLDLIQLLPNERLIEVEPRRALSRIDRLGSLGMARRYPARAILEHLRPELEARAAALD